MRGKKLKNGTVFLLSLFAPNSGTVPPPLQLSKDCKEGKKGGRCFFACFFFFFFFFEKEEKEEAATINLNNFLITTFNIKFIYKLVLLN
jgi:hypothetical protein